MTDWLLNRTFGDFAAVLILIATVVDICFRYRARKAAETVENLVSRLELCKDQYEKAERESRERQIQMANLALELDKRRAEGIRLANNVSALHSEVSGLEKLMTERPSLISWGPTMYREAFPADPDNHKTHKFYCAACWNVKRLLSPVETHHGSTVACKNWREAWHREHQSDPRL